MFTFPLGKSTLPVRPDDAPRWVVLSADAPAADFDDPVRGLQVQGRWLGFVREVADDLDPAFGDSSPTTRAAVPPSTRCCGGYATNR